jgi:hypothetical protein
MTNSAYPPEMALNGSGSEYLIDGLTGNDTVQTFSFDSVSESMEVKAVSFTVARVTSLEVIVYGLDKTTKILATEVRALMLIVKLSGIGEWLQVSP